MNARLEATLLIEELLPRLRRAGVPIEHSPVSAAELALAASMKRRALVSTREIRQMLDRVFADVGPG